MPISRGARRRLPAPGNRCGPGVASVLKRRAFLAWMIHGLRSAFKRSSAIYAVVLEYFLFGEFPSLLRSKIPCSDS